jgi:hypothetical protein
MESYDKQVEWALIHGIDPQEHMTTDRRVSIKEGSRLVNDLALIQEARVLCIKEYLKAVLVVADGDQGVADELIYSQYASYRKLLPHISPYEWEAAFGKATAKMELRFALDEYAAECAATGKVFHHLGRDCDRKN